MYRTLYRTQNIMQNFVYNTLNPPELMELRGSLEQSHKSQREQKLTASQIFLEPSPISDLFFQATYNFCAPGCTAVTATLWQYLGTDMATAADYHSLEEATNQYLSDQDFGVPDTSGYPLGPTVSCNILVERL
jgi:hypothetical protein